MAERKFTRDELATYDGSKGRPAYVAWQGRVYDVSDSALWDGGEHFDEHVAGTDLTEELEDLSPHGPDALETFPVVGTLVD